MIYHCADGGAPLAQLLVHLQESVQRQGEARNSLGNEPKAVAMNAAGE